MKVQYITIFIFILSLSINICAQNNDSDKIAYSAVTRGSSIHITVTQTTLVCSKNKEKTTTVLKKKHWKSLDDLMSQIALDSIHLLKAPSNESARDKALIASITIEKNGVKYESATFDHGNPPEELSALIDTLFKLIY